MKKKYFISLWTKRGGLYTVTTNSLKLAQLIMKLNFWSIVKITDQEIGKLVAYKNLEKEEDYWV